MTSDLRTRLRAGEPLIGTWVSLGDPALIEVLGGSGFDFLLLDGEHAPLDERTLLHQAIAAKAAGVPVMYRVRSNETARLKIALDLGVDAVLVPWVNSAEDARQAVAATRYPPLGERGIGPWRASNYYAEFWEHVKRANEEVALVIQIEQARAIDALEEILAVEGFDAAYIGPADLGASLGVFGEPDPRLDEAIARISAACRAAAMPLGIDLVDLALLPGFRAQGISLFTYGADVSYLSEGAGAAAAALRAALDEE
jgi:4-hydroxy-2-oxoheptanedioate aldolase